MAFMVFTEDDSLMFLDKLATRRKMPVKKVGNPVENRELCDKCIIT